MKSFAPSFSWCSQALQPQFTGFNCPSKYGGTSFSKPAVWDAFARFPYRDHAGRSGYPHAFANSEGFVWDVNGATCNDRRACGTMMEMPISHDGGGAYAWDAWPRPDPGPTGSSTVSRTRIGVLFAGW
ncbi:hypothetical protein NKR19_g9695 [Coniochaeta hoffmannii]|uniref:Uncharacterized protein n=1 Tax=Coniochaeta hoffmannii TaxID=91930 RepID=A0AA38VG83_9PEZI|nr:hypothetical protein NKR19_g9695 [Coniochaeta hoffmannii]